MSDAEAAVLFADRVDALGDDIETIPPAADVLADIPSSASSAIDFAIHSLSGRLLYYGLAAFREQSPPTPECLPMEAQRQP